MQYLHSFPTRRSSDLLSNGAIRCIGSTTYKEFRNHFEKDRALLRRFQKIDVNEPTVEDRKSTRLNSSHVEISYADFCLNKKMFVRCGTSALMNKSSLS